jgi:hypothetical protein
MATALASRSFSLHIKAVAITRLKSFSIVALTASTLWLAGCNRSSNKPPPATPPPTVTEAQKKPTLKPITEEQKRQWQLEREGLIRESEARRAEAMSALQKGQKKP